MPAKKAKKKPTRRHKTKKKKSSKPPGPTVLHNCGYLVSKTWAAGLFDVGLDTLTRWRIKPVDKQGTMAIFDARQLVAYRLHRGEAAGDSLSMERAAFTREQRLRLERENAERLGQLLPVAVVEREWGGVCATIRQRLLTAVTRIEQFADHDSADAIREEIHAALTELGSDSAKDTPPRTRKTRTAKKKKRKRVGKRKPNPKPRKRRRTGKVAKR